MIGAQNEGGGSTLGSTSGYGGAAGEGGGAALKKGPWTAAEDAVLADYVRKHGEGNWNAVQKNTGLNRCGKSCRLRWANHLRPNLKKGSFTPEEERLIIELHAQLGNKWARMAAQLPGRTDNEIKNYWNTRVKRRQRQGLPLYPPDIHPSYNNHQSHSQSPTPPLPSTPSNSTSSFAFQLPANLSPHPGSPTAHLYPSNNHLPPLLPHQSPNHGAPPSFHMPYHHHFTTSSALQSPNHPITPVPHYSPNAVNQAHSLPPTLRPASPLSSPHNRSYSTLPLLDSDSNTASNAPGSIVSTNNAAVSNYHLRTPPSLQMPMRLKKLRCDDGDSSCNFDGNPIVNPSDTTTSYSMNPNLMFSPLTKSSLYTPAISNSGSNTLPHPAFPSTSVDPNTLSSRMQDAHFDSGQFVSNPGLVYPVKSELPSNQLLSQDGNPEITYDSKVNKNCTENNSNENQQCPSTRGNGTGLLEDLLEEAHALASGTESLRKEGCSNDPDEKNVLAESNAAWCASNSADLPSVPKPKEETADYQFQGTHQDLSKLLSGSGWYTDSGGEVSNGQSSVVTDDNLGLEMHHVASLFNVDNTTDQGRPRSSCSWDNMPGIC